jgi:hypothetical protein
MARLRWGPVVLRWPFSWFEQCFDHNPFNLASVTVQASGGAYTAGGKYLAPSAGTWTLAGSTVTFDYTTLGITFTASGSAISAVQYAVIHNSAGKLLCWSKLSSSAFDVADPNTLTVLPAATGVFTLT